VFNGTAVLVMRVNGKARTHTRITPQWFLIQVQPLNREVPWELEVELR
jgi:hypothetical protein